MSVVDEVKERLDIVEVISTYVPLQRSGRSFKALCPFHSEKTPSFYVFPENQRWFCFGACSEGGDIFSFVMKQEGWDFRTALEELGRRAGVEVRPLTPAQVQREEESQRLRSALDEATAIYHHLLLHAPEAESAREYVARRGLAAETVEAFQLGYSLSGWDNLRTDLLAKGFTVEELIGTGLLVERDDGTGYDRFRGRLMIPIRDPRGRVIGFGARTLEPDEVPKYINSPQSPLFDKSRTLYGLDLARQAIRQEDQVVIVEGYMDVMRAYQAGFGNVVAQMGTALTEHQVRLLQRYTRRFILALDPDAAGVQATLRGLEVARETLERDEEPVFNPRGLVGFEGRLGAEIRILSLPPGHDPDELIGKDPEQWAALAAGALPVVEFTFQRLTTDADLEDAKERARIVEQMLPLLRDVADPVERETYAQKVARTLHIEERTILARLHRAERRAAAPRGERIAATTAPPQPLAPAADLEGHCLAMLLCRPAVLKEINNLFGEMPVPPLRQDDFDDSANRAVFAAWEALLGEDSPSAEQLSATVPPVLFERVHSLLVVSEDLADEQMMRESLRAALRLRKRNLKRRGTELREVGEEADSSDHRERVRENARALRQVEQALARRHAG
jgi:DNA primase